VELKKQLQAQAIALRCLCTVQYHDRLLMKCVWHLSSAASATSWALCCKHSAIHKPRATWCVQPSWHHHSINVLVVLLSRYFAPANSGPPKGALSRSLRQALGPSFGSLCLASWLLNLLQMLKSMAESARTDNNGNILVQLLLSCFEFLISVSRS
jgi:hypothetical protein